MLIQRSSTARRGTIVPYVAVSAVFLFSLIAFAIDIGLVALARNHCQNAADAAAMAAVRQLNGDTTTSPPNNYNGAAPTAQAVATANTVVGRPIQTTDVTTSVGWYSYDASAQRFTAHFTGTKPATEAYDTVQVTVSTNQPTYFAAVFGVNTMPASATAIAVHRPRDIALVLDFSGSMKFDSETSYPNQGNITASLNPDTVVPRFGHWSTVSTNMIATSNYIDSGGEAHAMNNLTTDTSNGTAIVKDFWTRPASGPDVPAFYSTATPYKVSNFACPAPSDWDVQSSNTAAYSGDLWPRSNESTSTTAGYAHTVQEYLFGTTNNSTYTSNTHPKSSKAGPGGGAFDPVNPLLPLPSEGYGPQFDGYSMGPGYYGKTFYMWPPDPRYHPTNTALQFDWRQKFFTTLAGGLGTRINDNSRLWNSSGVWQPCGSTTYYIDYNAVITWIRSGPQVFPPNLRSGRVLYYSSIPTTIPATGGTDDQRFWRAYIDYVIGSGSSTVQNRTLYGQETTGWGTVKITPLSSLATPNGPYMHYNDNPIRPRLHMWFGPLSMLDFLATNNTNSANWWPGTCHEAQCWQLKAGMQSALSDIQKNHPNDWVALMYFSSTNNYKQAMVQLGRNYTLMTNMLWYPNANGSAGTSIPTDPTNLSNEWTPYVSGSYYSSGIDTYNSSGNNNPFRSGSQSTAIIPNANNGTSPEMGFMVAYNEFSGATGYNGRKGASKMVIFETDGVANTTANGTFSNGGAYNSTYTSISNGSGLGNANATVISRAEAAARQICNLDSASSPGYSTPRSPVRIHALAFGFLFESYSDIPGAQGGTVAAMRDPAMQFLYDVETIGATSPASTDTTRRISPYKIIVGDSTNRINRLRIAMQTIMQSGVQVSLIQ
jgi:Flp pilus assembly protein TadG